MKKSILEIHNKKWIPVIGWVITVGGWFAFNLLLGVIYKATNPEYYVRGGLATRFGRSLQWWAVLFVTVSATMLWELMVASLRKSFFPSDANIFQELEKDPVIRKRFADAVEGNNTSTDSPAGDVERLGEKEVGKRSEEVRREREVQELLDRPRVMDFGAVSVGGLSHRRISTDEDDEGVTLSPTAV